MEHKYLVLPLISTLLIACASTPKNDASVTRVLEQYDALESGSANMAPIAYQEATKTVNKLNKLVKTGAKDEKIRQQVYLAERRIKIVEEIARGEVAKEQIASSESRRKDIIIDAKTRESNDARLVAAAYAAKANEAEAQLASTQEKIKQLKLDIDNLKAEETERGLALTLNNILFEVNSSNLKLGAERTLEKVASFLKQYPERSILVEGFTDSTGSDSYNEDLSSDRAKAVKRQLAQYGVSSDQITTKGYGESFPVASNDTRAGRQENRRVEIILSDKDGEKVESRS